MIFDLIEEATLTKHYADLHAIVTTFRHAAAGGSVFLMGVLGFIPLPGGNIFAANSAMACSFFERDAGDWNQLGVDYLRRGELSAAMESFRKVLAFGRRFRDRELISIATGNIGVVYRARGDLIKARALLEEAVTLDEAVGAPRRMAISYGNLGVVYIEDKELERAEEMFKKALALHRNAGDKPHMARCYGKLGIIYQADSNFDRASTMYHKALALDGELGEDVWYEHHRARLREVDALRRRSRDNERHDNERHDNEHHDKVAAVDEDWRVSGENLANKYHELAVSLRTEGKLEQAVSAHLKAVAIDEKLERKESLVRDYSGLGIVYKTQGELSKAVAMHKKALVFAEAVGDKAPLGKVHANLGGAYNHHGDKTHACEHWSKARDIFQDIASATELDRTRELMKSAHCP
jgi:tetratricopeptide (TPR) repeat protein